MSGDYVQKVDCWQRGKVFVGEIHLGFSHREIWCQGRWLTVRGIKRNNCRNSGKIIE